MHCIAAIVCFNHTILKKNHKLAWHFYVLAIIKMICTISKRLKVVNQYTSMKIKSPDQMKFFMKTRNFYTILFSLFFVSSLFISTESKAQSETHDFITYDTLINGPAAQGLAGITWRLRISRPAGMFGNGPDSQSRPLIMFSPGVGQMGTNYSTLQFAGPHYWLNNGWDGGIALPDGKHYPILITAISSNTYFNGKEYAELLNIILSI